MMRLQIFMIKKKIKWALPVILIDFVVNKEENYYRQVNDSDREQIKTKYCGNVFFVRGILIMSFLSEKF